MMISVNNYFPGGGTAPAASAVSSGNNSHGINYWIAAVYSSTFAAASGGINGGGGSVGPIALSGLGLIEYLGYNEFSFFLFFVLSQMVLVHYPIRLLRFSVLPEVGVEY